MPESNERIAIRPTDDDRRIVNDLKSWLGIKTSEIVRLALRRLHNEELKRKAKPLKAAPKSIAKDPDAFRRVQQSDKDFEEGNSANVAELKNLVRIARKSRKVR